MQAIGNRLLLQAERGGQVVQVHVVPRSVGNFEKVVARPAAAAAHRRAYRRFLPKSR